MSAFAVVGAIYLATIVITFLVLDTPVFNFAFCFETLACSYYLNSFLSTEIPSLSFIPTVLIVVAAFALFTGIFSLLDHSKEI